MASKNNQYDIVTFIGVALSVAVLLYGGWIRPKRILSQQQSEQPAVVRQTAEAAAVPGQAAPAGTGEAPASEPAVVRGETAPPSALLAPVDIQTPWVRRDGAVARLERAGEMSLELSAEGTGIIRSELPQYYVDAVRGKDVQPKHVTLSNADFPYMALIPPNAELSLTKPIKAETTERSMTLVRGSADGRLVVTETWSIQDTSSYEVRYTINVANSSDYSVDLTGFRVEAGAMPPSVSLERKAGRGEAAGGASYAENASKSTLLSMRSIAKMKSEERARLAATPMLWTAVHSKYFMLSLWMKEGTFSGIECATAPSEMVNGSQTPDGRYHARAILPVLQVPAHGTGSWSLVGYAGPKDFERLCSYKMGLESVMDLDRFFFWRPLWMRYISRGLLRMLVVISGWFPKSIGYGMAVILLTLLVKLVFWPLSHKSTVSMRRMQALKPQLDALKEKYKNDPTTMYRKQQELFKENNVSQLGGCLPMLLQIPVFFALFSTFRNAIELRHASFLWAYDLSMPDTLSFIPAVPIRPFAILMAASMYLQQRMMPNPDPQQAKMMSFMTIFFMFLFYSMPSALTLYLTVSYLLGILQTVITNKMLPPVTPLAEPVKKA